MNTKTLTRVPREAERRTAAGMTGRYLVTYREGSEPQVNSQLNTIGLRTTTRSDFRSRADGSVTPLEPGMTQSFPSLGVALVDALPEQEEHLHQVSAQDNNILAVEPERINRPVSEEYITGFRDGVNSLCEKLLPAALRTSAVPVSPAPPVTWGLSATKVDETTRGATQIKIAVLDTGFDPQHPDFLGRHIVGMNFVGDRKPLGDPVGHGTHCIGTALGPLRNSAGPRYGVAYEASIYVGRVLDDSGRGGDGNILAGIDWAVSQGCEIISLSLGAPWRPGDPPYSVAYERAAQRALAAGSLLVVAAGNEAADFRYIGAVGTPGNTPSVLTVAAVDRELATAVFSNRSRPQASGVKSPDLAAPGVNVYSAWPVAMGNYKTISGTSMATPHVAGIAALYAQSNPGVRGLALKSLLLQRCIPLPRDKGEVGAGLVRAA